MTNAQLAQARRLEIQRLKDIPPLPMVAQRILQVLTDPEVPVEKVTSVIEQDPALAARLVGLANSAFFGISGGVKTVQQAIVRALGLDMVKGLAVSMAISGIFDTSRCPPFDCQQYWTSATKTAVLASLLAPGVKVNAEGFSKQHVYLAGLIHNLGLLALVHCWPTEMNQVLSQFMRDHNNGLETPLAAIEAEQIGANHYMAGGWLGRKWGLPEELVTVLEQHAYADYRGEHWTLVQLIGRSARWVQRLQNETPADPAAADPELGEILGISLAHLERVDDRMHERTTAIEDLARTLS